jgi:hypothetical protein
MSVLDGTPRRILLAAGLAITMAVTPAAATALIGAATVPMPRSVADPAGPCTVVEHNSSAYLYCAPNPWTNGTSANGPWGNGAPSEMGLSAANNSRR